MSNRIMCSNIMSAFWVYQIRNAQPEKEDTNTRAVLSVLCIVTSGIEGHPTVGVKAGLISRKGQCEPNLSGGPSVVTT